MPRAHALLLPLLGLCACRKGTEQSGDFLPVVAVPEGTQSCAPTGTPMSVAVVFSDPGFGLLSQLAAATGAAGADTLYWSASDGSIHELTLPSGGGASDAVLLPAGTIEADYLLPGIAAPAQVSGLAVLDSAFLVAAEHASNTLILVDRVAPVTVRRLAGVLDPDGGFSSGSGGDIRFDFDAPVPLLVDVSGVVWVGDTQNHALRSVTSTGVPEALTVAGSGAPGAGEGSLAATRFDTPSGLAATCLGELLVVESGAAGAGGHVLKSLRLGGAAPFGGLDGLAQVLAGDGTEATSEGLGTQAQLGRPVGLVASADGRVYWIDTSGPAVLRRLDLATGMADCPLSPDCVSAVVPPGFFTGETFSLAVGESGALYVLGASAAGGTLWRVAP